MSVAFRRESDEEHKEPKFDRPVLPGRNLVTQAGFAAIHAHVAAFERKVADATDDAARAELQRDLRYWRQRAATAEIAPEPGAGQVNFGSHVRFKLNGREKSVQIVGSDEANPSDSKIGFQAPLAQAMMLAEVGDILSFQGRADALEIVEIS